jgi:hypothetical protein
MTLRDELEARVGGRTYFPWYRYAGNQLRAQQGYLTKFPNELFELLPELADVAELGQAEPGEIDEGHQTPGRRVPSGHVARTQDPALRAAIERRSLDVALAYYARLGASDVVELGKPYDLRLRLHGSERHVEVKGSSMTIAAVELTVNEVIHANAHAATDLVVVDAIDWRRELDGSVSTSGGRLRVWHDWTPEPGALTATKFAYSLPKTESATD